jgi:arsenate reductase
LLDRHDVPYRYREYRNEPLTRAEIKTLLDRLELRASEVLRRRDRAFKELGLSGDESETRLIAAMAEHPTLLERPIGVYRGRAVVGRPPTNLLDLVGRSA